MTATLPAVLPTAKDVRDLLEGLFGKDVVVAPGAPVSLNVKPAVAVYVDPGDVRVILATLADNRSRTPVLPEAPAARRVVRERAK